MLAKKISFVLLALVFILPMVSAVDTQINVKTLVDHKVSIFVLAPEETYNLLESFHIIANGTDIVSVSHKGDYNKIKINVKITKDGQTVIFEKFDDWFNTGNPLYLKVIPGDVSTNYMEEGKTSETDEAEENETENATSEVQQNISNSKNEEEQKTTSETTNSSKKGGISGSAILGEIKKYTKVYYILGIIFIVGVIIFFVWRSGVIGKIGDKMSSSSSYDYDPIKYNFKDSEVDKLEQKMKSIQSEINKIKNQKKITEAEKKLEEDRRTLERLKKGDNV